MHKRQLFRGQLGSKDFPKKRTWQSAPTQQGSFYRKPQRMKGLTLTENEAELSKMDKCSKELNNDKSSIRSGSTMLLVVEEVASWPSIFTMEEEYKREDVLGSGR